MSKKLESETPVAAATSCSALPTTPLSANFINEAAGLAIHHSNGQVAYLDTKDTGELCDALAKLIWRNDESPRVCGTCGDCKHADFNGLPRPSVSGRCLHPLPEWKAPACVMLREERQPIWLDSGKDCGFFEPNAEHTDR
jgi:hypothetical protein